jgi:predicted permease
MAQRRFYENLVARVGALPGVSRAGAVTCAPFHCHWGVFFQAEFARPKRAGEPDEVALARVATPGYFDAMGIRLLRGRFFAENEGAPQGPRPVVINEQLEKQLWPDGTDPVGKRFTFRGDTTSRNVMTVVGVVRDVRHYGLTEPMRGGMYLPLTSVDTSNSFQRFTVVAHTSGDPNALFTPMRAIVRELDPELPLFGVKTMETAVSESVAARRAVALWLASLAGIALTLAVGGIYAMLSYVVGRRRHELGIRMALGARSGQVLGLVVRQGLRLVAVGVAIGIPVALFGTRVLDSLLAGIGPRDPLTYGTVVAVLMVTGAMAAWIPARRAAAVSPTIAMRE